MAGGAREQHSLKIAGEVYDFSEAEFSGVLFDIVTTLVHEKQVDRASYLLRCEEHELSGSGGVHFEPICASLYRHLKVDPYHGPSSYPGLEGSVVSFRLHSIAGGLVAVAFYLKAGDLVPHFMVGRHSQDLLTVLDRGAMAELRVDDTTLLEKLTRLVPT